MKVERRKWKNVTTWKEGKKNYRKLRNILTGTAEKGKKNTLITYKAR
jgi:hypothetical protein